MSSDRQAATPSARILGRVREDATDLALLATTTSHDWKLLSDKHDTQLYEMTGESLSTKISTVRTFGKGGGGHPSEFYLVRAATTVRADVNTMLDVLRTSTSDDFRAVMKKIFDKQFENGAVVDSLSCTTPPPYAPNTDSNGGRGGWQIFSEDDGYSANWLTLRAFSKLGGLEGHRDFTMVCYQDVFEQAYLSDKLQRVGRRVARDPQRPQPVQGSRLIGIHTLSSMNFKDIPELPRSSKTDRLHFRNSGVVVEEMEEDAGGSMVRVSLFLSLMPSKLILKEVSQSPRMRVALTAGSEVAKKYKKWLQTLALGVTHLAEAAKPSVTMQHLSKMTWTESDHCFLCLKTFRTYRRRHHCRFCGEAVCGSCSGFVNMAAFDVNYEGNEHANDNQESITVGHRKLDVRTASDGSGRSDSNPSGGSTEEFLETRGCNTCVSELQMNLTILSHGQQELNMYTNSSTGSLSQLVSARLKNRGAGHGDTHYANAHDPPPPYPGRDNDFDRDQAMPMLGESLYRNNQQYSGQAMSFSTISSSSYSGLSQDERTRLGVYHSTNSAEFMGKAPPPSTSTSTNMGTPSSFSTSDASLSAFLARDPDILSLNGLTLSPSDSITPSTMTPIDDDEHMDLVYKRPSTGTRSSYATTANTNEGSGHSQFLYANMTPQEVQTAEKLIREANTRGNCHMSGRPPLMTRHRPQYQPDFEKSPVHGIKKVYDMPRAGSSSSLHSSGSAHSDLIQLTSTTKKEENVPTKAEFVVFDDNRQTEVAKSVDSASDMIPLSF